jgi:hypothetical protein
MMEMQTCVILRRIIVVVLRPETEQLLVFLGVLGLFPLEGMMRRRLVVLRTETEQLMILSEQVNVVPLVEGVMRRRVRLILMINLGVLSVTALRGLVVSSPLVPLEGMMRRRLVELRPETEQLMILSEQVNVVPLVEGVMKRRVRLILMINLGVLSVTALRDLVVSSPLVPLEGMMRRRLVVLRPETAQLMILSEDVNVVPLVEGVMRRRVRLILMRRILFP